MARRRALSQREVDGLREIGMHWVADNLYLQIRDQGTRSWLYRYWVDGKPKVVGLKSARDISLAEAKNQADRLRIQIRDGADPASERKSARLEKHQQLASAKPMPTFEECARTYIASHEASWKNEKHRRQWSSTLKSYVYPVFGNKPVNEVGIDDVMKVLKPIWHEKPQTAGNIRGRIDKVLGWATAMGYRTGDNPASRTGPLEHLLPSLGKVKRVKQKHHAAVPYGEVPVVVAEIGKLTSVSSKALLFTILTAARTSEALLATWDEIDLDQKLWSLAADRMKAGAEHKVPLSTAAVDLIAGLPRTSEYLFPGAKAPTLSNMAMLQCLRGVRADGATVHGFRSSFSTWAREQTDYSPEIIEAALAHQQADKVVAAYARTTYLERRRELMEAWGRFCLGR